MKENLTNRSCINLWTDINFLIKVFLQRQGQTFNNFFISPYKWLLPNNMSKKMHTKRNWMRKRIFITNLCKKKIIKTKKDILNVDLRHRQDLKHLHRKVQPWLLLTPKLIQTMMIIRFNSIKVMKPQKETACAENYSLKCYFFFIIFSLLILSILFYWNFFDKS